MQQQYSAQQDQPVAPNTRPMTEQERVAMDQARGQQQPGAAPDLNYQPQVPEGFPLSPDDQTNIENLLDYWQQSSEQVKRSTWDFQLWDYDPTYCQYTDPETGNLLAFAISKGQIRFAAPEKGRYDVTESYEFFIKDQNTPNTTYDYRARDEEQSRERWICDGTAIYQYNFEQKRVYKTDIPAELQGQGLVNSPLPFFLFGANRQMILDRYWVEYVNPPGVEGEYWLEIHPKRASDARNYKKIVVIISAEDFLPSSLEIFHANFDPAQNRLERRVFAFSNRKVNDLGGGLKDFFNLFVRPPLKLGWKQVNSADMAAEQQQVDQQRSAQNPSVDQEMRK